MKKALLLASLLSASLPAFAGRPLATDDAGTVGDKQCQFEVWRERSKETSSGVAAPACGLGEFELGAEFDRTKLPDEQTKTAQGVALKWAPEMLKFGPVGFGAKLWTGRARVNPAGEDEKGGWQPVENGALALASWDIGAGFTAHANLGSVRDRIEHQNVRLANLALSYAPHERVLLFAEAQNVQRAGTTQSTGLRLWAIPEKLGIDLTASRVAGVSNSNSFGVGFGWYGILGD
ncbi:hypothetical protein [Uliginosibacterium flavum]|uniref:Transporter n=1 Tax=Uliginosibacterium flavum TaxID=1396831 RepID=A0ABV2TJG5_9RHOO